MHGDDHRFVTDSISGIPDPDTEINIFKPDWTEALIEAAETRPGLAADEQERAGGLFGIARLGQVQIEAALLAVDRIAGPNPVQPHVFKGQRRGRGEASQGEAALRRAARLAQSSGRNGNLRIVETNGRVA